MDTRAIGAFYAGWHLLNDELTEAITRLDAARLAIMVRKDWPVWASVSHLAGTRAYWLCMVCKEPGLEQTPFADGVGWEDDLSRPRRADELAGALRTTWDVIAHVLDSWTPESLAQEVRLIRDNGEVRIHTRGSILWRLITHEAFHCGEISLALGEHGITGGPNGPIDLWRGLSTPSRA